MNTPLREELRDLVFKYAGGIKNMGDEETDEILNLIASKMPEKLKYDVAVALRDGSYIRGQEMKIEGYNKAIDSVKSILKGGI